MRFVGLYVNKKENRNGGKRNSARDRRRYNYRPTPLDTRSALRRRLSHCAGRLRGSPDARAVAPAAGGVYRATPAASSASRNLPIGPGVRAGPESAPAPEGD